jgi:hypothetical protein
VPRAVAWSCSAGPLAVHGNVAPVAAVGRLSPAGGPGAGWEAGRPRWWAGGVSLGPGGGGAVGERRGGGRGRACRAPRALGGLGAAPLPGRRPAPASRSRTPRRRLAEAAVAVRSRWGPSLPWAPGALRFIAQHRINSQKLRVWRHCDAACSIKTDDFCRRAYRPTSATGSGTIATPFRPSDFRTHLPSLCSCRRCEAVHRVRTAGLSAQQTDLPGRRPGPCICPFQRRRCHRMRAVW